MALRALLLLALTASPLLAQTPRALSLADAVALARRNNPGFLSVRNDEEASAWQVREAYASLLPTANASGAVQYQEAGVQRIGNLDFGAASTDYLISIGVTKVLLLREQAVGTPWEAAGNRPVDSLQIRREDVTDAVVFYLN